MKNKFNVGDIVRICKRVYQSDYLPYDNISDWRVYEVIHRENSEGKYVEYLIKHIDRELSEIIHENVLQSRIERVEGRDLTK